MLTVDGIPLHPLVIHGVVVLLPLSALGAVLVAVRPKWRRAFGVPVLLVALVGVGAVPVATQTGGQLRDSLPGPNPAIALHQERGETLLPYAIGFLALLTVAVILGIRDDRAAATPGGAAVATTSRLVTLAAVLAAVAGLVVTGLVIWIGDSGAAAVWGR